MGPTTVRCWRSSVRSLPRDELDIARQLDSSPDLASCPIQIGATRQDAQTYFLAAIRHYVYAGDTALHIAAAGHQRELAESLVTRGADGSGS